MHERYCAAHEAEARQREYQRRGSAASRLYGPRWRRERAAFLRDHPLCAICLREGRIEAADTVDHIIPHRGDLVLFWDKANWQSLSNGCHSIKTAQEDGGFGNPIAPRADG